MQPTDLLWPVFLQVGLTFVLLVSTGLTRVRAVRRGEVKAGDVALGQDAWPVRPTKLARAYGNQLELPVLFYVLVVLALITSRVDAVLVMLAWVFVLARIWHAVVHTTHNDLAKRFRAFAVGVAVLAVMWIYFASTVLIARLG